jgi:hypothetical protein
VRAFIAAELGSLAPKLQVLDLSSGDPTNDKPIANVSDLHAALTSLPNLRFLLADAGMRLIWRPPSVGDQLQSRYFAAMSPHASLEYVRYPARDMVRMDAADVAGVMRDVDALLVACPALRILDFTACITEWPGSGYEGHPGANRSFFSKLRRKVKDDEHGASRLTHIFATR